MRNYRLEFPPIAVKALRLENGSLDPNQQTNFNYTRTLDSLALNSGPKNSVTFKLTSTAHSKRKKTMPDSNEGEDSYHSIDNYIQTRTVILSDHEGDDEFSENENSLQRLGREFNDQPILDGLSSNPPRSNLLMSLDQQVSKDGKSHFLNKNSNVNFQKKSMSKAHQSIGTRRSAPESPGSDIINDNLEKIKDEFGNSYDIRDNQFEKYYHNIGTSNPNIRAPNPKVSIDNLMSNDPMGIQTKNALLSGDSNANQMIPTKTSNPVKLFTNHNNENLSDVSPNRRTRKTQDSNFAEALGLDDIDDVKANMIESKYLSAERRKTEEFKRLYFQRKLDNIAFEYDDPLNSNKFNDQTDADLAQFSKSTKDKILLTHSKDNQTEKQQFTDEIRRETGARESIGKYYDQRYQKMEQMKTIKSQNISNGKNVTSGARNGFTRDPFIKLKVERIEKLYQNINVTNLIKF